MLSPDTQPLLAASPQTQWPQVDGAVAWLVPIGEAATRFGVHALTADDLASSSGITLGRAPSCSIVLEDLQGGISSTHCTIYTAPASADTQTTAPLMIRDLNSSNGTRVDHELIRGESRLLKHGSEISFGKARRPRLNFLVHLIDLPVYSESQHTPIPDYFRVSSEIRSRFDLIGTISSGNQAQVCHIIQKSAPQTAYACKIIDLKTKSYASSSTSIDVFQEINMLKLFRHVCDAGQCE